MKFSLFFLLDRELFGFGAPLIDLGSAKRNIPPPNPFLCQPYRFCTFDTCPKREKKFLGSENTGIDLVHEQHSHAFIMVSILVRTYKCWASHLTYSRWLRFIHLWRACHSWTKRLINFDRALFDGDSVSLIPFSELMLRLIVKNSVRTKFVQTSVRQSSIPDEIRYQISILRCSDGNIFCFCERDC